MRGPFEDYSWNTSNLGGKENYPNRSFNSEKDVEVLVILLFAAATPTLSQRLLKWFIFLGFISRIILIRHSLNPKYFPTKRQQSHNQERSQRFKKKLSN